MHALSHRSLRHSAAAALCVAALAGCSSSTEIAGGGGSQPSTSASTSSLPTDSTTPGSTVPGSTVAPATTVAPAPTTPTTAAPVTTAPSGGASVVLGAPTVMKSTGAGVTLPSTFNCGDGDPGIPGWVVEDCQQMPSHSNGVTVLVLRRADDGSYAVSVLFGSGASLVQRYRAEEEAAGVWTGVTVQLGDYNGDDGAEVWVGYRYDGSGQYLDLDVLDPRADGTFQLGGLQGLDHGVVDLHPGGATVQSAVYGPSDAGCCPSSVLQRTISYTGNRWRVNTGTTYPSAPAVSGDF